MQTEEIFKTIRTILANALLVEEDEISMDTNIINDLCPDSLVATEITMALEDAFSVSIADGEMKEIERVDELTAFIQEKMN